MIPEDTIARVRESVNLVELVRESVPGLKKAGRNFLARCPFHQERTPSFNVNPELGLFKCFGCGVGGDVFKFVMLQEGLNYPEAIRKLAGRVGVTIEEERQEVVSEQAKERETLYSLLEDAARFYQRHLLESPDGAAAREYLLRRGLTEKSMREFTLGFAPASGHALRDAALRKGWNIEILEKAGLIKRKDDGRQLDHFWNRIVFPIWDVQGRLIAFGGRAMGEAIPKYINSPETPVYSKSRHLYGLFQTLASVRRRRHVVVLEGYMDVIVCQQFGIEGAIATLGTALTDEHVRLLRRYVDHVTLLFDPDAAGAQAAVRGGELLIADAFGVDVVTLPDGKDPDEILVERGVGALEQFLKNAEPFMDFFIRHVMQKHPGLTPESKLAAARDVLPVIRRMKDPLLQDEYLARLATALQADKAILGQQMKRLKVAAEDRMPATAASTSASAAPVGGLRSIEEEILLLAIHYPGESVADRLEAHAWQDERCAAAWSAIAETVRQGAVRVTDRLERMAPEVQEWLTTLAMDARHYARPDEVLNGFLEDWGRRLQTRELQDMKADIDAMISGVVPMDDAKVRTYNDLSRKLKGGRVHG